MSSRYTTLMRLAGATLCGAMFCALFPAVSSAALLYLDPPRGTYGVGDTFIVSVRVDNQGECINAAEVALSYPTHTVRAVDFSRGDSIFTLWAEEPSINTDTGSVTFSGGVPGGYCGRVQGDPSLSNIIGKIVFTVIRADEQSATLTFGEGSAVYLHDGLGTESSLQTNGATFTLQSTPTLSENEWLSKVREDTIPPDSFSIEVQSTRGIFGGRYYAVFSTVDKQSGLDHYEIFERGSWRETKSPHQLKDQSLSDIQIRAIDKAGNIRMGQYILGSAPPRQGFAWDGTSFLIALTALLLVGTIIVYFERRKQTPRTQDSAPPVT